MRNIVRVKDKIIGDGNITIQSMTNVKTSNCSDVLCQISQLYDVGCDLVRISIEDNKDIESLHSICKESPLPVIADIQYNYRHAIEAINAGASKIRINPSYLRENELSVLCKELVSSQIPVRVGVNEGSTLKDKSPSKLAQLAIENAKRLSNLGVENIVIAAKTSDVRKTIAINKILYEKTSYPIHIGVTEAGTENSGLDKSFVALGSLLLDGIGDTIRISLSANPVKEVVAAKRLLRACGIDKNYVDVISCPTCGRTNIDVLSFASHIEAHTKNINKPLKVAIMGCAVNGIGESRGADVGVCGGKNVSSIFVDSKIVKTAPNEDILEELLKIINKKLNN